MLVDDRGILEGDHARTKDAVWCIIVLESLRSGWGGKIEIGERPGRGVAG